MSVGLPTWRRVRASWPFLLVLCAPLLGLARAQDGDKPYAPTFPADLPFDAKEWLTNDKYKPLGDPRAKRDSKEPFVIRWETFPPTLRTEGPNSGLVSTSTIHSLMYESLIQIDPETSEFLPCLASHWKVETDEAKGHQTFSFHIDPRARWADGSEVTADDVAASFWHRTQEDRDDPSTVMTFSEGYEQPEILDKHTIRVRTKELNWRLFLYFGGMSIYPAKQIRIPGAKYLEDYNWKFQMGSGPYFMKPEDLKKGESLTLTRRSDWWAENEPWGKNTNNFAQIKAIIVRDEELWYQMFKKGELDHYVVSRAQKWVQEYPKEEIVQKGWVKRRKVFNQAPRGFSGLEFNMREKPFDDKNVRLAFCYLFNRERLMDKLFFNEYEFLDSYFPGRDWGNGDDNDPITYDPDKAAELLAAAGYKTRDKDGFLVGPDGKRFEITLELGSPTLERIFLVVKEDYEKAGIKLELKVIDGSTLMKKVSEREFKINYQAWGGLLFPNPETSWRSTLADEKNNNNHCGFKNARVDELCKKYNVVFDRAEQKKIIREIDKLIYDEHPYALGWYARYHRVLYWDKFGHPDSYFTKTSIDPEADMMTLWWFDTDRVKALEEARAKGTTLEQGEVDVKPWDKKK
jgi:microcin C transport system substrate-binding protein